MADDKELSQLESTTNPSANDLMYIVSGGNSRKIPYGSVFPKDDYYIKAQIDTALDGKADENEATPVSVSGNPITITDAANIPCESLSMTIEPIQAGSGTPSPTNVRPIIGLTEATAVSSQDSNLIQLSQFTGDHTTVTVNNDKLTLYEDGTHAYAGAQIGTASTLPFSAGSYFVSFTVEEISNLNTGFCVFGLRNSQYFFPATASISLDHVGEYKQILTIEESCYVSIILNESLAENEVILSNIRMVKVANTATITFGENVYGGNVDFDTGVVTVTKGMLIFDGDEDWIDAGVIKGIDLGTFNKVYLSESLCDRYNIISDGSYTRLSLGECAFDYTSAIEFYGFNVYTGEISIAEWKANLSQNPLHVCYELKEPTTLTLTPAQLTLLKGYNTVSANGATINLDYQKDNLAGDVKQWVEDRKEYYSTTEQKTNKVWIDGKPIYQKTISASGLQLRNVETPIYLGDDVENVIRVFGRWKRSDNTYGVIPQAHSNNKFCIGMCDFNPSTKNMNLVIGSMNDAFYLTEYDITIQYTKTTD